MTTITNELRDAWAYACDLVHVATEEHCGGEDCNRAAARFVDDDTYVGRVLGNSEYGIYSHLFDIAWAVRTALGTDKEENR